MRRSASSKAIPKAQFATLRSQSAIAEDPSSGLADLTAIIHFCSILQLS